MDQPVPRVGEADVERVLRRDFAGDGVEQARAILKQYGGERWHREDHRVRLACLKLAAGNLKKLQREIDTAKLDYRDVLAPAEYPNYLRKIPGPGPGPADHQKRVVEADWQQYERWLNRRERD